MSPAATAPPARPVIYDHEMIVAASPLATGALAPEMRLLCAYAVSPIAAGELRRIIRRDIAAFTRSVFHVPINGFYRSLAADLDAWLEKALNSGSIRRDARPATEPVIYRANPAVVTEAPDGGQTPLSQLQILCEGPVSVAMLRRRLAVGVAEIDVYPENGKRLMAETRAEQVGMLEDLDGLIRRAVDMRALVSLTSSEIASL